MKRIVWGIIVVAVLVLACYGAAQDPERSLSALKIILILLAIAGVCLLVVKVINTSMEAQMGKDGWRDFQRTVNDESEKKKYNNYMITCPICKSSKVKKISDISRATSVAIMGLASSKIGKQYECDNCHHKW